MPEAELRAELAAGVTFVAYDDGEIQGVMGPQDVKDVSLIRHAYVRTNRQGEGVGATLLAHHFYEAAASTSSPTPERRRSCVDTGPSPSGRSPHPSSSPTATCNLSRNRTDRSKDVLRRLRACGSLRSGSRRSRSAIRRSAPHRGCTRRSRS